MRGVRPRRHGVAAAAAVRRPRSARLDLVGAHRSRQSISGALGVAAGLSRADARTLTIAARQAFDDAAQAAFLAGAVVALVAAAVAVLALRNSAVTPP